MGIALIIQLLLSACSGTGPEKREYPLVMAWDYDGENYEVIYGTADLSRITAQDKESDGESSASGLAFTGRTMEELRAAYDRSQQYYLDLGHVQAIIFSRRLTGERDAFRQLLESLEDDTVLGKNAYVFAAEEPGQLMEISAGQPDTLGEYLTGLYENKGNLRGEAVLLEDVCYDWNNYGTIRALPRLQVKGDQVTVLAAEGEGL